MINSVFSVEVFSRNKFKDFSFIIDKNSLRFSSKSVKTFSEFQESWGQQALIVKQVEIAFQSIHSIIRHKGSDNVAVNYKNAAGISTNHIFRFKNEDDYRTFIDYMASEKRYKMKEETLSPFAAIRDGLILCMIVVGFTIFSYIYAQSDSVNERTGGGYLGIYKLFLTTVGHNGVLVVGFIAICLIVLWAMRKFKNPPIITSLRPPKK